MRPKAEPSPKSYRNDRSPIVSQTFVAKIIQETATSTKMERTFCSLLVAMVPF